MRSQQWDLCLWLQQCVLSKSSFECKRGMFYSGKWIPTCRPGKEKRHWWQLKPLQCNPNGGIGSNRSSKSPTAVKVRGWVKLCTIVVSMTWVRCRYELYFARQGPRLTLGSQAGERTPKKAIFQLRRCVVWKKYIAGPKLGTYLESAVHELSKNHPEN